MLHQLIVEVRSNISRLDSRLDEQLFAAAKSHVKCQLDRAKQLLSLYRVELQEIESPEERAAHAACSRSYQDELRTLHLDLQTHAQILAFADLPLDAIRTMCTHLPSTDLAQLCLVCRAAAQCIDHAFRSERAANAGLETYSVGGTTLEVLALHETLGASLSPLSPQVQPPDYTAQIGFEFGGTMLDDDRGSESSVPHSRLRIRAIGFAMQRHPSATAIIETHVGIGAPSDVAAAYCVSRGAVIAAWLVWYFNIAVERITVRAWGKRITKLARRSSHPNGDCARSGYGWGECILSLAATELPCRPDYYGHGVGCLCELGGTSDDGLLASKVSDVVPELRAAARGRLAAVAPPRPSVGSDDGDEDDDEDEEEEESDEEDEEESDDEDGDGMQRQLFTVA